MRTKKRILSMIIAVFLIVGILPQTAFATEGATIGTSGLCEHHAVHDKACGYVEETAETPCAHAHTEACYPVMDSSVSGNEATPFDAVEPICGHACSGESGCITEELSCTHTEHDSECGYIAAVEGHDCHYECGECAAPVCTCEEFCDGMNSECSVCAEDFDLCTYYVPTCYCVEKCTEDSANESCDICAADYTACTGEDSAAAYSNEYNANDVAAIQAIINASPTLSGQNGIVDPSTWETYGLVKWNEDTTRRATILKLQCLNDEGELTDVTDFNGTLDASDLTALKTLFCSGNTGLTELKLPQTGSLIWLSCYDTGITELDISGCTALEYLECYNTGISALNVSSNTALTHLDCEGTDVSSLELSGLSKLENLYCSETNITSLDVSSNSELTYLNCVDTQITALDLSANRSLTTFDLPATLEEVVTPGGYRITMTQTSGGTIQLFCENDNGNPIYRLKALADPDYVLARWKGVTDFIDGTTVNDVEIMFNITGNMDISADFMEKRLTLASLAVEGATLAPAFSGNVFHYTAEVTYDVTSVNLVAEGWESYEHKITGTGVHELNVGGNTFVVTVIVPKIAGASNINVPEETITQEYVITVTRQAKSDPPADDHGDDTPSNTPAYVTYTVQKGDTLWAIARKYGCTVSGIVAANSDLIKNPDLIYAGWQLNIPQAGATGTDTTPDAILPDDKKTTVYIVQRGDTLWTISKKYGCTVAEIVALNGELITDPDLIFAGWELKIPQD